MKTMKKEDVEVCDGEEHDGGFDGECTTVGASPEPGCMGDGNEEGEC